MRTTERAYQSRTRPGRGWWRHIVKEDSWASRFVHEPATPYDREEPGRFEGESIAVV
jgi:hypothetical protein